jgi:hypothetical protein
VPHQVDETPGRLVSITGNLAAEHIFKRGILGLWPPTQVDHAISAIYLKSIVTGTQQQIEGVGVGIEMDIMRQEF